MYNKFPFSVVNRERDNSNIIIKEYKNIGNICNSIFVYRLSLSPVALLLDIFAVFTSVLTKKFLFTIYEKIANIADIQKMIIVILRFSSGVVLNNTRQKQTIAGGTSRVSNNVM
ncbi:MAG: hypothetical protein U0I39_01995 [Clostridia bacterium]|nr:hypothetical protein [Clostridium sp.]MEE0268548.1 hypothetical protein [Clostridia bacterium]